MQDITLINRKNKVLFNLIIAFYVVQVVLNVFGEGITSIFPMVLLFAIQGSVIFFMLYKGLSPKATMFTIVISVYLYFYFLLNDSPYLVNYFFMWLGLPLSSLYQNIKVILLAGSFSLVLTTYSYFNFREEIFPNVVLGDFVYLILFGIFLTAFFIISTRLILQLQDKISHLAYHDHLTGVANRHSLERKFADLLNSDTKSMAVLFIDLNSFKQINDQFGHKTGDELLQKVVDRINGKLSYSHLLCRLGGDEFAILAHNCSERQINNLKKEIYQSLEPAIKINEHLITVSASIGMTITSNRSEMNLQRMLDQADTAMYLVKHA